MYRKPTQFIGIVLALLSLSLLSPSNQATARATTQTDPTPEWNEGQQVAAPAPQADATNLTAVITPGTFYRTFSGTRFLPTNSSLTFSASGGALYVTSLPGGGFSLSMDFDLPQGATITEVVFFVVDNHTTNLGLSLRSYNPETNVFTILESAASSGASAALQTIVIPVSPAVLVDNTTTSYRLRVAPGVASIAHLLRGARIGYTVPLTFLPMLTR